MKYDENLFPDDESDDKEWEKAMDELIQYENAEYEKFRKNLKHYLANRKPSQPVKAFKEFLEGNTCSQHIGYVDVYEYDDKGERFQRTGFDRKLYKVTEESAKELPELEGLIFTAETDDDYGRKPIEYLCWQTCYWEDDYRGYLLFPMQDGRYWCIYYTM